MTPEELEARRHRCGASDAAAIMGLNPKQTPWETWGVKTGRLEPFKGNEATRAGVFLEPLVLDFAEAELGPLTRGEIVWAKNAPLPLASTMDARVNSTRVSVEGKTSGIVGPVWGNWGEDGTDDLPTPYLVQLVIQMICNEHDLAKCYALIGGRGFVRYQALRDDQVCTSIVEQLARWWERHIEKGEEPPMTEAPPLEVAKRLRKVPNKIIDLGEGVMPFVEQFEHFREYRLTAKTQGELAQSMLLVAMGDAEGARLPDGRMLTYIESSRSGYTVQPSKVRRFNIKKG